MTATRVHADPTVLMLDANAGSGICRLLALIAEPVADGGNCLRNREQSLQFFRLDQERHSIGSLSRSTGVHHSFDHLALSTNEGRVQLASPIVFSRTERSLG